jgi:uncharacterized membrane protein
LLERRRREVSIPEEIAAKAHGGGMSHEPTRTDRARPLWSRFGRGVLRYTYVHSHPRLAGAAAAALLLYFLLAGRAGAATRFLIAADGGALVFLAVVWIMMASATPEGMRRRAELEDEGRYTILVFSVTAAIAILITIIFELHGIKDLPPPLAAFHVALAAGTILLSWLFMNTIFALHYAHGYYGDADPSKEYKPVGGLVFPGQPQPDYWDFLYFSFVVGMTFQVSDVEIEDYNLRRGVLAHGVLAFFFNVIVVALTINIVAGLV